jgi:hypothetical protein
MRKRSSVLKLIARINSHVCRKFLRISANPKREQEEVLMGILEKNRESVFGRNHGFSSIRSVKDFKERVPITDYESISPYVEREMKGEGGQLTADKVISFATTSGTVSSSKFIPITREYIKNYQRGMAIWTLSAFQEHPEIASKVLSIVSRRVEGYTTCGIPYGAITGLMFEEQSFWSKILSVSKKEHFEIKESEKKMYTLARAALGENLSYVHTANALTILNLCRTIENNSERLIRDINDGTCSEARDIHFKKNIKRAGELESMLKEDKFSPKNFWPNLALVGCWMGGTQNLFIEQLKDNLGDVPYRDIGLIASEGRMTIPIHDNTSSGVLDISGGFFEFVREKEINENHPETLRGEEIRENENYFILMTTRSGLYRYNILDLVRCTGFYNKTPQLAFLNKGQHISNVAGEKISEYQVVEAYKKSKKNGMPFEFVIYPRVEDNAVPRYIFLSSYKADDEFLEDMDRNLSVSNLEYDSRRRSGKLDRIEAKTISDEEFRRITRKRMINGKEAQYKHKYIGPINLF